MPLWAHEGSISRAAGWRVVAWQLRLAFEAAPFGLLVEKAGGKTSNGIDGASILDSARARAERRPCELREPRTYV